MSELLEKIDQGTIAEQLVAGAVDGDYKLFMRREVISQQYYGVAPQEITQFVPTAVDKWHPEGLHMEDWLDKLVSVERPDLNYQDFGAVTMIAMKLMHQEHREA